MNFNTYHIFSGRRGIAVIGLVAAALSLTAFLYFFSHAMTNLYGDGVAHVNIARKVVDSPDSSLWQRYMQIGSPWLPLQTALMLPLVANDWMWRTGVAGSILSMFAFIVAAVALFLHARYLYGKQEEPYRNLLPVIAAAVFILNPSALYMQTTPMTELIFLATITVAALSIRRWVEVQTQARLVVAALAMTVATLARYEAWPVAFLAVAVVALCSRGSLGHRVKNASLFSAIVLVGPIYWLWHNWAIYGDALWFLTGPYSARGLYLQNRANLGWSKIFVGHALLDVLLMAVTVAVCVGPLVMLLAATGLGRLIFVRRREFIEETPALLLLVPFFFHVFSLYRGEIQIFPLSVFGLLNARYGLPHLAGAALFAPAAALLFKRVNPRWAIASVCLIVAAQYLYLVSDGATDLAVYQEAYRNGVNARPARERARASAWLKEHPPEPVILMNTGALGPLVSEGGLRFSEIVHEGTKRWHQIKEQIPDDVSTIVIQEGDPLDLKLRENAALARDLAKDFQERFAVGNIRIFER